MSRYSRLEGAAKPGLGSGEHYGIFSLIFASAVGFLELLTSESAGHILKV